MGDETVAAEEGGDGTAVAAEDGDKMVVAAAAVEEVGDGIPELPVLLSHY